MYWLNGRKIVSKSFLPSPILPWNSPFVWCDPFASFWIFPVFTVNIESVASPPNEGDGTGVAAVLRLTTSPPTATLAANAVLSVSVMAGGSATGKLRMGIGL